MSMHEHHDEDVQMAGGCEDDNSPRRRHPHSHLHLNPTIVIDHIKTRVKRRRPSNNSFPETLALPVSNDNNTKRAMQTLISSVLPSDHRSDSSDSSKDNAVIHAHSLNKEDDINELTPKPIDSDRDTSPKTSKSKGKPLKSSTEVINTKSRAQKIRRTGFQIRDEDFNKIFNNLPSDEQIIISYPCAWQKDGFMNGRLFLSVNYLCFYACLFKYEESLCIAYKDIVYVSRKKATKDFPTVIQVKTKDREKYRFGSSIAKAAVLPTIIRLWKNALLDKPLDYSKLRADVHADELSIDDSVAESEDSVGLENNQVLPEKSTYVSTCSCDSHLARTFADRLLPYPVDTLFDLIFGNNSFTRAFQESQKLIDHTAGEWCTHPETGQRERIVTYRTVTQSMLGTNMISCHERQVIETRKSHSMYVVSSEVSNEGMKYTDAFRVATKFCMYQRDPKHSTLRISAEIKYIKNVNAIARAFIDKNANASLEDMINHQVRNLENHQAALSNHKSTKHHLRKKTDSDDRSVEKKDNPTFHSMPNQPTINETSSNETHVLYNILLGIGVFLLLCHIYLCYKMYVIDQFLNNPRDVCSNQCKKVFEEKNIKQ